jgi:hypothetical protein
MVAGTIWLTLKIRVCDLTAYAQISPDIRGVPDCASWSLLMNVEKLIHITCLIFKCQ